MGFWGYILIALGIITLSHSSKKKRPDREDSDVIDPIDEDPIIDDNEPSSNEGPIKLIRLRCPSCHAELDISRDRETCFCSYCGAKIYIADQSPAAINAKARVEIERVRAEQKAAVQIAKAEKEAKIKMKETEASVAKSGCLASVIKAVLKFYLFLLLFCIIFLLIFWAFFSSGGFDKLISLDISLAQFSLDSFSLFSAIIK